MISTEYTAQKAASGPQSTPRLSRFGGLHPQPRCLKSFLSSKVIQ